MLRRGLSVVADILAGLVPIVLFIVADTFFHVAADMRVGLTVLALLYFCTGLVRGQGRPKTSWLKGLLIGSGGSLVLLILLWSAIFHLILGTYSLTASLFAVAGVRVRRLWEEHAAAKGGALLVASLASLVLFSTIAVPALTTQEATHKTDFSAPTFSFDKLDGTVVNSSDLRGRVAVVDFWATWCPACRRELPELEKVFKQYKGNPKVSFWAVDVQKGGETPAKAQDFMQKAGYTIPTAFDSQKASDILIADDFPSLIIIDKRGRIRLVHTGYDNSEQLQGELSKEIDALLEEQP